MIRSSLEEARSEAEYLINDREISKVNVIERCGNVDTILPTKRRRAAKNTV